jgi:hypothetical protein
VSRRCHICPSQFDFGHERVEFVPNVVPDVIGAGMEDKTLFSSLRKHVERLAARALDSDVDPVGSIRWQSRAISPRTRGGAESRHIHCGWSFHKYTLYRKRVRWLRWASMVFLGIAELSRVRLLYNMVGACADAGWMSKFRPKAPLDMQRTRP